MNIVPVRFLSAFVIRVVVQNVRPMTIVRKDIIVILTNVRVNKKLLPLQRLNHHRRVKKSVKRGATPQVHAIRFLMVVHPEEII